MCIIIILLLLLLAPSFYPTAFSSPYSHRARAFASSIYAPTLHNTDRIYIYHIINAIYISRHGKRSVSLRATKRFFGQSFWRKASLRDLKRRRKLEALKRYALRPCCIGRPGCWPIDRSNFQPGSCIPLRARWAFVVASNGPVRQRPQTIQNRSNKLWAAR